MLNEIRIKMLKAPFRYKWPGRNRITMVKTTGPMMIDKVIGEAAIEQGYAEPFDPAPANPPKPARRRRTGGKKAAKSKVDAADKGKSDRVGDEDLARDDRADDLDADDLAGERQ